MLINLQSIENNFASSLQDLHTTRAALLNLGNIKTEDVKEGLETAEAVVDTLSKTAGKIGEAVEWSDKVANKAADVDRIKNVMNIIKEE